MLNITTGLNVGLLSIVAVVLVIAIVVAKILTATLLERLRNEVAYLEQLRRRTQARLDSVAERRLSLEETRNFHERRKDELAGHIEDLLQELEQLEEAELEYRQQFTLSEEEGEEGSPAPEEPSEEEIAEETAETQEETPEETAETQEETPEETAEEIAETLEAPEEAEEPRPAEQHLKAYQRPGAFIDPAAALVVVPARAGVADDLLLPDAITTELLEMGLNVVERTALAQQVREQGLDPAEILDREEYFKLGEIAEVSKIAIVNSTMSGGSVASATCRVIDISTGDIVVSTSYDQPAPDDPASPPHQSLTETARTIAEALRSAVRG